MLFNSLEYFIFFPLVVLGFFLLPGRLRWLFLLAASYFFYMSWKPSYAILILITTISTFYLAKGMAGAEPRGRGWRLWLGLFLNFGILVVYKYANFAGQNLNALFGWLSLPIQVPAYDIVLPVGISFYTFQAIGYLLDVFHQREKAEPSLSRYALYVSFFPQLVAGPIERAGRLIPQLGGPARFDYFSAVSGLKLIAWGLFKKLVIADRLAALVNPIYADPTQWDPATLLLATYAFTFQIYCDFSGYSDIAIGSAQVMGIDLMTNFDRPYAATGIRQFWRRWHISLSTWFRDYLYFPLGGNRTSPYRMYYNIMVVFLVCGLWHGAAWTFVVWGGLHGLLLVGSHVGRPLRDRLAAWPPDRPGPRAGPAQGGADTDHLQPGGPALGIFPSRLPVRRGLHRAKHPHPVGLAGLDPARGVQGLRTVPGPVRRALPAGSGVAAGQGRLPAFPGRQPLVGAHAGLSAHPGFHRPVRRVPCGGIHLFPVLGG